MFGLTWQYQLFGYLLLAFLLPIEGVAHKVHPLHVCTTDINLNNTDHKLEVIATVFTDDFEAALAKAYPVKVDLVNPAMHTAMDALIKKYITTRLLIKANAKTTVLTYIGFEIANDVVNAYFESADKILVMKRIDVDTNILYDYYSDQSNIVHITVNGKRQSTKIDSPDRKVAITY